MGEKIKVYKGTDKDLKCRGYQFEVGKLHTENKADMCHKGFHACEYPLDVFGYYPPSGSRYFEAELDASPDKDFSDSKRVGKSIRLNAEIGIPGIVKDSVEYIKGQIDWSNAEKSNTGYQSAATNTGDRSAATNTGNWSAATNTGDRSAATNTGHRSAATNTGNWSAATNTGNWSAATNTGDRSEVTVSGKDSVGIASGYMSKARGEVGNVLCLIERDKNMKIVSHISIMIDGNKYKSMVYYTLVNGEVVEAKGDD